MSNAEDKIDINLASQKDFENIENIGKTLAERIAASRPLTSWKQVEEIRNIGPKRIGKLREKFTIESDQGAQAEAQFKATKEHAQKHTDHKAQHVIVNIYVEAKA